MPDATPRLLLHHAAPSRSSTVLWMLEELGEPYDLHVIDLQKEEQRTPEFLAINPMGKVPTLQHGDVVVTEVGAICMYLADAYPAANLTPPIGDPRRGPYVRWMFFQGNCLEPAIVDKAMKREPGRRSTIPYGDFDTTISTLAKGLGEAGGPWFLGDQFTALDVYMGSAIKWTMQFGLLPPLPEFTAYASRISERPALIRAEAKDAELAPKQPD